MSGEHQQTCGYEFFAAPAPHRPCEVPRIWRLWPSGQLLLVGSAFVFLGASSLDAWMLVGVALMLLGFLRPSGRVVYLLGRSMLVGVAILLGGGAILRDGATLAAVTVLLIEVAILFRPELLRRPVAWWTKDDVPLAEDDSESPSAL
jgi:hypothetical protein